MIYEFKRPKGKGQYEIVLDIATQEPRDIVAVGFDPTKPNTEYFFRNMQVNGPEEYKFPLPLCPKSLHVLIFDMEQGLVEDESRQPFKLSMKAQPLKKIDLWTDKLTRDWILFSNKFCETAGYIPAQGEPRSDGILSSGYYRDPKGQFVIHYLQSIKNCKYGTCERVDTPARIHKTSDVIQVSKADFKPLTVPNRKCILEHEFSHNYRNNDQASEIEADLNGIQLYLAQGFPMIEAVYSFTKIFSDTEQANQRLRYIDDYLKRHQLEKERKELHQFSLSITSNRYIDAQRVAHRTGKLI